MTTIETMTERRELGLKLHRVETGIWLGKQSLQALYSVVPVDLEAADRVREGLKDNRRQRTEIRRQLREIKRTQAMPPYNWHP